MALSAEERLEILDLYARYCHAVDYNQHDDWAACIAVGGTLRFDIPGGGPNLEGPDSFREYSHAGAERLRNVRHWTTNYVIDETAEGARGACYLALFDVTKTPRTVSLSGRYEDTLVKEGGRWKFKSRLLHLDQVPALAASGD